MKTSKLRTLLVVVILSLTVYSFRACQKDSVNWDEEAKVELNKVILLLVRSSTHC